MQQSKFVKRAEEILEKHPGMFDALLEFEKTGKIKTKSRANFTIDRTLLRRFRRYCKENHINMSAMIEDFIRKKLKKIH